MRCAFTLTIDVLPRAKHGVRDRARLARPVTDQADAIHAEQRRAAVLVVVMLTIDRLHDRREALGEIGIDALHLAPDRPEDARRQDLRRA